MMAIILSLVRIVEFQSACWPCCGWWSSFGENEWRNYAVGAHDTTRRGRGFENDTEPNQKGEEAVHAEEAIVRPKSGVMQGSGKHEGDEVGSNSSVTDGVVGSETDHTNSENQFENDSKPDRKREGHFSEDSSGSDDSEETAETDEEEESLKEEEPGQGVLLDLGDLAFHSPPVVPGQRQEIKAKRGAKEEETGRKPAVRRRNFAHSE